MQDTAEATSEEKLYKAAIKLIDSSRYKEALAPLKKAVKLKPDYREAFTKIGLIKTNIFTAFF